MTDRLADLFEACLDTAATALVNIWAAIGEPVVTIWATIGAMPLPVALAAASAGLALAEATRQRTDRSRKD